MVSMPDTRRTSLIIRCRREDAQTIYREAAAQRRNVSGYLLHVMERSLWVEKISLLGLTQIPGATIFENLGARTAIHLRCTAEEANRIREAAKRRLLSISKFVVFSLHRQWRAVDRVRNPYS